MENLFENLNDRQREAVMTTEGPLLVIAGAGSGKTTVLTRRIAYILKNCNAMPWNILAITFTNKAANEMKERIENIIGEDAKKMWIGTFHSICVKILRTCIDRIGYRNDFVIYDSADSRTLIKECMHELDIDEKVITVRTISSKISNAKNDLINEETYNKIYNGDALAGYIGGVYKLYQRKLKSNNALDFDDIIRFTVEILRDNEDIADMYQSRFKYILVDEYQDTNNSQYALVNILAQGYGNVCVVGDDDQSIYKFRGANVNNILDFEDDYKDTKKIKLEQNYRSTEVILEAANSVIDNNMKRMGKKLWTMNGKGELITSFHAYNDKEEGVYIARKLRERYDETGRWSDCAVLYRTNSQSRAIEEALMREAIPYKVLAGLRFYDRKEIKDVTAYLRLIYNHDDDVSFRRIINEPKRKIGDATVNKVQTIANLKGVSCFAVADRAELYPELKTSVKRLKDFTGMIKKLRAMAAETDIYELACRTMEDSGYMDMLKLENSVESRTRVENVQEYLNVVHEFSNDPQTSGTLGEFLESIALISDIDSYDSEQDSVVLMTVHSAKGLEFPVVFIVGFEDGLFPSVRSADSNDDIEEERRLCYVAITRAKEKLYITMAGSRFRYGTVTQCIPSRFYKEIPQELIESPSIPGKAVYDKIRGVGAAARDMMDIGRRMPQYNSATQTTAMNTKTFSPGDRVHHRKFGDGTVVTAQQFGKDAILVIDFDTAGSKRLMAAFAKLELIK